MKQTLVLETQQRDGRGTRAARRVRAQGLVPAIVYGHQEANESVSVSHAELYKAIRQGTHVLDLKTSGNIQKVLIREVQWDHLGHDIVHVDFARVAADERVTVTVPIEIRGTAPGVSAGGVLDQPVHSLHVECLVTDMPDSIRVNIGELMLGSMIHVRDLQLPPNVRVMDEPDTVIVLVAAKKVEEEPAVAAAAAPEQAEPEIIGRKVAEEGEAE